MKYDYLIVGSGLFGSIFAYEANKRGKKVLVIDKRSNIAGNIYTENVAGARDEYQKNYNYLQVLNESKKKSLTKKVLRNWGDLKKSLV